MKKPTVSVCIPVFNCEEYIGKAIESIIAQTFTDWELLILNNASTDNTKNIVRRYSDPRIRQIENQTNIGLEANWNKALGEAKGEYIKILPADDFLYPDCLERQVSIFKRLDNQSVVMTCCGRNIIDQDGNKLITRRFPGKEGRKPNNYVIKKVIQSGTNLLGEPGAILFKAEVLLRTGGFDGSLIYVIDVDLWLRILSNGDLYVAPESLCAFRLSTGSCSIKVSDLQSAHFTRFIKRAFINYRDSLTFSDMYIGIFMSKILSLIRKMVYLYSMRNNKFKLPYKSGMLQDDKR